MSNTLNNDLWLDIFTAVIQQSGARALFTICAVNAFWRQLASCSPLLWMNVVVNRVEQLRTDAYIQRFISNSAMVPLNVTITFPEYDTQDDNRIIETLKAFRVCASRVESLRITGRDYRAVSLIVEAMGKGQAASMLHSLHISVQESDLENDPSLRLLDWLSTSFSAAPNLRNLTVPAVPLPKGPIADFLMRSVASLSISTGMGYAKTVPVLELLGHASTEDFYFYCSDVYTFNATHDLHYGWLTNLPMLKSLDVTAPGSGTDILRNISAPVLRHLRLDGWRAEYIPGHPYWHDVNKLAIYLSVTLKCTFIRSPNLRSLHLEYIDLDKPDEEYRCILANEWFPNLEELVMKVLKITDKPFIAAASKVTSLKKLVLFRCKRVTPVGLRAFVAGRDQTFCLILELVAWVADDGFRGLSDLCYVELGY